MGNQSISSIPFITICHLLAVQRVAFSPPSPGCLLIPFEGQFVFDCRKTRVIKRKYRVKWKSRFLRHMSGNAKERKRIYCRLLHSCCLGIVGVSKAATRKSTQCGVPLESGRTRKMHYNAITSCTGGKTWRLAPRRAFATRTKSPFFGATFITGGSGVKQLYCVSHMTPCWAWIN